MLLYKTELLIAASLCALGVGCCCGMVVESFCASKTKLRKLRTVRKDSSKQNENSPYVQKDGLSGNAFEEKLLIYAEKKSKEIALGIKSPLPAPLMRVGSWYEKHAPQAGIVHVITREGLCVARLQYALVAAAVGLVVGALFSGECAFLLMVVGFVTGWRLLKWAVCKREKQRAEDLERHLPEMLEVVALGLRSGLSFDRSLELYVNHFDRAFAQACAAAQKRWFLGLATRENALRELASSYDSKFFSRVVENIIRSLRFGSSLAESLEVAAAEARSIYRVSKQEQVAKAPIKMMIPTGTLMLPAMLLLVLGPILLELVEGF